MTHPSSTISLTLLAFAIGVFLPIAGVAQPANDECPGATVIAPLPFSTSQNTRLATDNVNDPVLSCADGGGGKTVWFRYTADATRFVKFSTLGSSPADYDIALALFTGACGGLTEVKCNDDSPPTRHSVIFHQVQSGTTYYIHVAEWDGGGPNGGGIPTGGDLVLNVLEEAPPPPVRGPKTGTVSSGVMMSTDGFSPTAASIGQETKIIPHPLDTRYLTAPKTIGVPTGPEGSNYIEDRGTEATNSAASRPVVVKNFAGLPDLTFIPPDPEMAVGPDHVVACVNSRFRIWDKNGTILKTISLTTWFNSTLPGLSFGDPQIIYDHFANRWVIIGHNAGATTASHIPISVSDDSNPLGTWYNWALPSSLGDSLTTTFDDYPQLGFDEQAIYITIRMFNLNLQGFLYSKIRIIDKATLYANTGGPITWTDFWDLRDPSDISVALDGIQPAVTFGTPGVQFLMNDSPFRPGTYFTLWKITNPLTSPSISAVNIPVVAYSTAPNANQLGGGTPLVEAGGSRLRGQPVYRDSSLWAVHAVASGTGNAFSAVRYLRLNPHTNAVLEDVATGMDGFWHFYPTIMVDQNKNPIITYSRSGTNEYIGAFVSGRKNTDPPGLSPTVPIKTGEANYVKTFSGPRNRWGDYMGIALDPSDGNSVWAFTQYAASPANTWGTWVGKAQFDAQGAFITVEPASKSFKTTEVGFRGDTLTITIRNNGVDTLRITNLAFATPHFQLVNPPSLPRNVTSLEVVRFDVSFVPQAAGNFRDTLVITSNAVDDPMARVALSGTGFVITPARAGVMYATSGNLLTVNPNTGGTTNIGPTSYTSVLSARVHPTTKILHGLVASGSNGAIVRINSEGGDAHPVSLITQPVLKGMAFRGDTLYIGRITGQLYRVDINTGASTLVATTSPVVNISGLAFHPTTGQLYASVRVPANPPDRIYKVDLPSGTATLIGSTGQGPTQDIIFSKAGQLFGLTGTGATINSLIRIDTTTGVGTLVGSMGVSGLQALATRPDSSFVTGIAESGPDGIPVSYSLAQNYPNPFNPATQISFGLPQQSHITLTIYNVLGQEVATLFDGIQSAGYHEVIWDGTSAKGSSVASGLYFYKLEAKGQNGKHFVNSKKMLLLK